MSLIFLKFLKSYWKHLIVIGAIVGVSFMTYNYIYDIGYRSANVACEERMRDYTNKLSERIESLELNSITASKEEKERDEARKKDLEKIIQLARTKPLTIIKEGKCTPSESFIEAYNAAILRANQK